MSDRELMHHVCQMFDLGALCQDPELVKSDIGRNPVWKLTTNSGAWAVKSYKQTQKPMQLQLELELFQAGIRLPEPQQTRDGQAALLLPGQALSVREWIDAPAASWQPQERSTEIALSLARQLAQIHGGTWHTDMTRSSWALQRKDEPHWEFFIGEARKQNRVWAAGLQSATANITWAENLIAKSEPPTDYQVCHLDANPHNVLYDEQGIYIIDWDGAGLASSEGEIASVIASWACGGDGAPFADVPHQMMEAYRDSGGVFSANDTTVFAQHLIGWLNWIENQVEVALQQTEEDTIAITDQSVEDLIVWSQRIEKLPEVLVQLV